MKFYKIIPLLDRVIIKPILKKKKSLIITSETNTKSFKGQVLAVGKGKNNYKMTLKIGDIVLYGKYSGTKIRINNKKYLIMHESDVYAILK
ncbi:MAG: GroES family chaperonin [Candidatus Shikimatogenerans sp. Tduv]|uniref:10 kDa chaperonin n=1 Tax=Candidatus Shikimatogenerans sp. Tduv TaxID=3158567 RepID=A0AAU7QRN5_9FLAO